MILPTAFVVQFVQTVLAEQLRRERSGEKDEGGEEKGGEERERSAEGIQCEILFHFTFSYKLLADSFRCKCNVYLTGPRCIISHPCETRSRQNRDFLPTQMSSAGTLFAVLVEFSRRIVQCRKRRDVETSAICMAFVLMYLRSLPSPDKVNTRSSKCRRVERARRQTVVGVAKTCLNYFKDIFAHKL